jgi:hypothetical protein
MGLATDIAVGPAGSLHVVGQTDVDGSTPADGNEIRKYDESALTWGASLGRGTRIAVGAGVVWTIDKLKKVKQALGSAAFTEISTGGQDIAVGANGLAQLLNTNYYSYESSAWVNTAGNVNGVRINADKNGDSFIVTSSNKLMFYEKARKKWWTLPYEAKDVGAGKDGTIWTISTSDTAVEIRQFYNVDPEKTLGGYEGYQSQTVNGNQCQRWDEKYPHNHSTDHTASGHEHLKNNYCRNPSSATTYTTIWCYTVNPNVEKEDCAPLARERIYLTNPTQSSTHSATYLADAPIDPWDNQVATLGAYTSNAATPNWWQANIINRYDTTEEWLVLSVKIKPIDG